MLVTVGWMLLAGLPLSHAPRDASCQDGPRAAGRVTVWTDREEPYRRGEGARVYLTVSEPSHVVVFRVDTDGRLRVLFPREPWTDTFVRDEREFQVTGLREDPSFVVDDDPGVGYIFAITSSAPFDFGFMTRGDYWDYRLLDGGRIQGDPYVSLTDLAARLVSDGGYDYDVTPYYVDHRFDYPRFVCYDCHAYASYREWNPYRASCSRYRVVIRNDPRYYPYRYGGRNVVAERPAHPGPRFVFRDADPRLPAVSVVEPERRRGDEDADLGRTSVDIGGPGAIPAPRLSSLRRRDQEASPEPTPPRAATDERRRTGRPEKDSAPDSERQHGGDERIRGTRDDQPARDAPAGLRPSTAAPRSTGEPELKRRRP
jgi:hypothetical protein